MGRGPLCRLGCPQGKGAGRKCAKTPVGETSLTGGDPDGIRTGKLALSGYAQRVAGRTVGAEREATEADGPERRPETGGEEDRGGQDAEAMPLRQRHDQRRDGRGGKDRQHPGQKPRPIDDLDIRSCIHG
jgi:hypothetical protein